MELEDVMNKYSYDYYYKDVKEYLMRDIFNNTKSLNEIFERVVREAYAAGFCKGMQIEK